MKKLVLFSIFLAMVVIVLGAYTRLTDAGLGCPDWPGCYGQMLVPEHNATVAAANAAFPHRPVESHKAWNEMIHRYFAGTLGLCILAICIMAILKRGQGLPLKHPLFLLALVGFQAILGMWTVTLNLLPVVVMGHLLGGFAVLSGLFLLYLRLDKRIFQQQHYNFSDSSVKRLAKLSAIGVVILIAQIALGGWTSANYAALACTNLPICEGNWWTQIELKGAYSVPYAENYEFGVHSYNERMTMHILHRAGALITFGYLLWLGIRLYRSNTYQILKAAGIVLIIALAAQVGLGVSNVVLSLPVFIAVAHNAVAACLLLVMVWITYHLSRPKGGLRG
ncbi:heme A synthase [Alteromonas pelagimontana]|uniref:Heme A synthase n=1 Tax=Alteromonas pelagimontana TaxID=1858656 RepID=A0A6M4MFB3_9ALTE|nr:COX15/CtaA family protein [Alteromonas pelagimontana]QJR80856.1 heme A synthase [Alteromonas pelagimontana]